ncbi:MAG: type II toxin-antitoxin system RelE/ParE family toxin [Clostridia bacterium]|nr:type II toxin-antitoxin system RelE/ParE family toxin [Clostridia bacterium]
MEYNIQLTDEFIEGIDEICYYISSTLKSPVASNKLRQKVMYTILTLEKSPRMFTKIEKFSKTKKQYRRIVVNNYVILYTIDEEKKTIYIAHIYYQGRNYIDNLF